MKKKNSWTGMNWIENTRRNWKLLKNSWKNRQTDQLSLNMIHEDVVNFIFLLKRDDFLSSFYIWILSLTIDKIHWNEIRQRTYQWILSFYMRNRLDILRYCWFLFLFFFKGWIRHVKSKLIKPQTALNKNCFACLSFNFTSDAFLSLLKGITICTCSHLIVHVSAFDRVNSIMFISPNFPVNKLQLLFY